MDDPEINEIVRGGLAQEWSPEQITGRMQQQHLERSMSPQTIYAWIKQDVDRKHWETLLRRRGKRPCRRKNAATTGDAARIRHRPEVIEQRRRLGVAGLEVDGIDFTAGTLRLRRRKEREGAVLPIPQRLRTALKTYLQKDRPTCTSTALFVRHHAPLGKPITPIGICDVVLRLASRAGLRHRVGDTHVLRQSLASQMLGAGATLKQIADLLGHQSLDTTSLYAKVDLATLSRVALPWPMRKGVHP